MTKLLYEHIYATVSTIPNGYGAQYGIFNNQTDYLADTIIKLAYLVL